MGKTTALLFLSLTLVLAACDDSADGSRGTLGAPGSGATATTQAQSTFSSSTLSCTAVPTVTAADPLESVVVKVSIFNGKAPYGVTGFVQNGTSSIQAITVGYANNTGQDITVSKVVQVTASSGTSIQSAQCSYNLIIRASATSSTSSGFGCTLSGGDNAKVGQPTSFIVSAFGGTGTNSFDLFYPQKGMTYPDWSLAVTPLNSTQATVTVTYITAGTRTAYASVSNTGLTGSCVKTVTVSP